MALLAIPPTVAADLTYDVRHRRALKDHAGVLTIDEKGMGYQEVIRPE